MNDGEWMRRALDCARRAGAAGEVPVGAVLVRGDELLAEAGNGPIAGCDPTAHAEIVALREAARREGNYRLPETTLYVTLEPCTMCIGALVHARIGRVVYGATDPRSGAAGGAADVAGLPIHNHRLSIEGGLLADESATLLREFFRDRRG